MGLRNYFTKKIIRYLSTPISRPRLHFFDFNRMCDELRPGDVVLIEGRNRTSEVIKRVTFSPWTHSALYIGKLHEIKSQKLRQQLTSLYSGEEQAPVIIESHLGMGTVITSLKKYRYEHMRICRPIGLAHDDAEKVITFACRQIGKSYNVRHFFDLGRFLLKSKLFPRLWRSSLLKKSDAQSSQEMCSTMIAQAFGHIEFPILPLIQKDPDKANIRLIARNPRLFIPSDFDYSPYFNIIKYPIFKLSTQEDTRDLPWDRSKEYSDGMGFSANESYRQGTETNTDTHTNTKKDHEKKP